MPSNDEHSADRRKSRRLMLKSCVPSMSNS